MASERDNRCGRGPAGSPGEQRGSGLECCHQAPLILLFKAGDQLHHLTLRPAGEGSVELCTFGSQCKDLLSAISLRHLGRDQLAVLESAHKPAEIAVVEDQVPREIGDGQPVPVRDLVDHTHFGQREATVQIGLLQQTDQTCVDPVEAAQGICPQSQNLVHCAILKNAF